MNRLNLLRLGLFQLAAGATSVIFLGVVNRVMRVELGIDLFVVSVLVGGGHYLGALVAIPFGHYSDTHPLKGYRRTVYALGGAVVTALLLAVSPFVVAWLSQNQNTFGFALGFGFFLLEGVSTFIAGTAYLALIADLTAEKNRGQASSVVWTLLMVGIIATGITTSIVLKQYSFSAFLTLTMIGAGTAIALAVLALFGQEPRATVAAAPTKAPPPSFGQSLRLLADSSQSRWFAGFLMLAMFSFFMYDVILEPFGGEVFKLTVGQTAGFNSYLGVGVVLGMLLGGMGLIPRFGKSRVIGVGCSLQAGSFLLLAYASVAGQVQWLNGAITLLGFGSGLFTVGGVAMMLDMTTAKHAGLFAGTWTLVQALGKGTASIVGGRLQTAFVSFGATTAQAYAGVFVIEALGLLLSIYFLSRVGVQIFREQVVSVGQVVSPATD